VKALVVIKSYSESFLAEREDSFDYEVCWNILFVLMVSRRSKPKAAWHRMFRFWIHREFVPRYGALFLGSLLSKPVSSARARFILKVRSN
jgi:hypothetical protein